MCRRALRVPVIGPTGETVDSRQWTSLLFGARDPRWVGHPSGGAKSHMTQPISTGEARLPDYAVISPVRDEAEYLARTADSMIGQTHRPTEWVIVDDGSTDDTRAIAERYAAEHDWIRVIDSGSSHERARGAPIVRAFNAGLAVLRRRPEVLVKMDGDLFLPSHYFEWVARAFARDPRAGIVGGAVLIHDETGWRPDSKQRRVVRGVAKAYRTACFDDIGGLKASMGWDGIDEYGAQARGWNVHMLSELQILHYKQRGSKQAWYRARWEEGRGNHAMGYRTEFLLLRVGYRMLAERPPVLGGLVLGAGFAWARLRGAPMIDDPPAREALRARQRRRMKAMIGRREPDPRIDLEGGGPAFWSPGD